MHEVAIRGSKRVERHLCDTCARAEGLPVQTHLSVPAILSQFLAQQAAGTGSGEIGAPVSASDPTKAHCKTCGTTYGQFRHSGLLGCPDCYTAFEVQLGPLLQRAHEGGTHHVGKSPQRVSGARSGGSAPRAAARATASVKAAGATDRRPKVEALQKQLSAAVAAEQYEAAAKLRDELRRLEGAGGGGTAGAATP